MSVAEDVTPAHLASLAAGLSGAQIEHIANEAGLLAIKEALARGAGGPAEAVRVRRRHLLEALTGARA
jgi:SpoVK/Ycf46/Vps4 family AAA+-type ATPase